MKEQPLRKLLDQFLEQNSRQWAWETKGNCAYAIKFFIRWLEMENWTPKDLDAVRMRRFIKYMVKQEIHHERRWRIRMSVFRFLKWLHSQDYPMRVPEELLPYQKPRSDLINVELPKIAEQFLEVMSTRMKPSTVNTYKTGCKHFYHFMEVEGIGIRSINREYMEKYFKFLVDLQQGPSTRLTNILTARTYLTWLKERKEIAVEPIKMVTAFDYPRVPNYLPRPLPPSVDQLIQRRLAKSKDILHRALLLMRWTGIRIGELSTLSYECVHSDIHGHKFLKVPLGKLNNERLVPVDDKTLKLITLIKRQTRSKFYHDPPYLLSEKTLKPPPTYVLMNAFREIYEDIKTDTPIVSHRLRHTYATELLSAGMNICALKEALGHTDIKMTLRYAAVTQEKVRTEYFSALKRMKEALPTEESLLEKKEDTKNYNLILSDLVRHLQKNGINKGISQKQLLHLVKRVRRLKEDIKKII